MNGLPIYNSPGGYTVMMWVKGAAQTAKYIFTEGSTASVNPLLLIQTGNAANTNSHLDILIRTTAGTVLMNHVASTSVVFDNTWHHIAWVDDRGAARLYVDGNLDGTSYKYNYATANAMAMNTSTIGQLVRGTGPAANAYFNGQIDEVCLWERPLSQDEVNQVRTNGISIPTGPLILGQPIGSTNSLGDRALFSVSAVGTPSLSYQWLKNGSPLSDETGRTLVLTDVTASGSNNISVIVNNTITSVTSDAVPFVVLLDPAPDMANGLVSYWPFDTVVEAPAGTNSPDVYYGHTDLGLTNMSNANLISGQFSNALSFSINQYGKRVGGTPIYTTTNYTVSFWVNGNSGQLNKQVFAEGGASDYFFLGTENPVGDGLLDVKSSGSPSLNDRKSTRVVFDGTWHHILWVDVGGKARLFVDGVLDETDFTYNRSNLVLSATAVGALYRASAADFFFGSVDELALWNRALTWTEIQAVRTNGVPLPEPRVSPTITQQPPGSTNRLGDRVSFSVTVTGSQPLSYQWLKDNAPLPGETNSFLTFFLTAAATNDYSVIVTNIANSVTSDLAHLVVLPDPAPDLSANLLNYWPLDTAAGAPAVTSPDLASHNDLLLNGLDSNSLVPGQFANALSFAGGQYAQRVGGFPVYLITNYTVSLWVNGYAQAAAEVFAEGSSANITPLFIIGTDNAGSSASADIFIRTDGGVTAVNHRRTTRAVFDGAWHHLVWVDENGQAKVFVDGVLDETSFAYTRGTTTLDTTAIGAIVRATTGNFFTGAIDEVAVWNRGLSWTEIQQIHAATVPAPTVAVGPSILVQPADLTNFFFATTSVGVVASGTGPLSFQWRKDGTDISAASNPSATNATLNLGGLLPPDAAGGYSVFITNNAGAITSRVAQLVFINDSLKVDFDTNDVPDIQPGFLEMTLAAPSVNLGGITVSVSAIGGIALAARDRAGTAAAQVVNNPPFLTQAQLYNDFIFGNNNSTLGAGINILIEHLIPNTHYGVTFWSFDPQSVTPRVSDWTEIASGTTVPIATGYTFNGSVLPVTDYEYTLGGLLTSSPEGRLQIQGVKTGGDFTVFLNALRIEATPTPTSRIVGAGVVSGNLRLLAVGQYPGQPISFEQNANLGGGAWVPAIGANPLSTNGMVITVEFPVTETQLYYRAVSPLTP